MTNNSRVLAPYAVFAFVLGFAWFMLAPLVPNLIQHLKAPLASILLLVSLYGYAMIVGALPAGFWTARSGPRPVLRTAVILTVAGLLIRALATSYGLFLVGQIVAALAYPLLIAPIGSVLRLSGITRTKAATGMVIGTLFFGMALGSLTAPHLRAGEDLWLALALNLVVGVWLFVALGKVSVASRNLGRVRIVASSWWIIGFVVSSVSVIYGSISTTALTHLHVAQAATLGGLLSSLTFLGSAMGAVVFGWIGQARGEIRSLQRVLAVLTLVFLLGCAMLLTGVLPPGHVGLDAMFLAFGIVSNGWYTLALESAANVAQSAGSAGLATAGYSMASNIGVAILPSLVGPLVVSAPAGFLAILAVLVIIAALVPFITRASGETLASPTRPA